MHDVAKESGVSPMTVSRVLSGRRTVDPQMRRRVLAAARRLDYVPNALASSFSRNRAGFIGVATAYRDLIGTTFFREVMLGFQSAVRGTELDFALFDCTSEAFRNPKGLARIYRQKKAGGLLIMAPQMEEKYLRTLSSMGIAFVVAGERVTDPDIPSVCCNDARGIEIMIEHLLKLGHRRIGFICGPSQLGSAQRRESAFRKCVESAGLALPKHFVQPGDYTVPKAKASAAVMLKNRKPPTAIICANDQTAKGAVLAAREMGVRVPEDVSIGGFDGLLSPEEDDVSLTTIYQPVQEIAALAAKRLLDLMAGKPVRGHVDIDVSLVIRETTGPAR
jgi:DNA-binding LacI/PurR family transcriptional regulator